VAVAGSAACSSDGGGGSEASPAEETVARIKVFAFAPNPVKVPAGTKVTWVNDDDIGHTVTSGKRAYEPGDTGKILSTEKDGAFDIVLDTAGKRGSHTFEQAGTFHYFCDRHPGMEGEVVVS
jgi:plastocyanin